MSEESARLSRSFLLSLERNNLELQDCVYSRLIQQFGYAPDVEHVSSSEILPNFLQAIIEAALIGVPVAKYGTTHHLAQHGISVLSSSGRKLSVAQKTAYIFSNLRFVQRFLVTRLPKHLKLPLLAAKILNHVLFLMAGKHPTLKDRIIGTELRVTEHNSTRVTRYPNLLLWDALSDLLVALIRILPIRLLSAVVRSWKRPKADECPYCMQTVQIAVRMTCGHRFCYFCAEAYCAVGIWEFYYCPTCWSIVSRDVNGAT